MFTSADQDRAQELLGAIQFFSQKGWSPATSTNYSVRSTNSENFILSRSGVDKSLFRMEDFLLLDSKGSILKAQVPGAKPSAETDIHLALYDLFPEIGCVLHTHSVLGTVLSRTHAKEGAVHFEGWEILKGLEGNTTHAMSAKLPIVPNSQDMADIVKAMKLFLRGARDPHGFLIEGHGLYTWGKDVASAKRHIETYEFLFECLDRLRR